MSFEIIAKGGPVMIPIIALSIYTLGVCLYKIQQLITSGALMTGYVDRIMGFVKKGELTEASRQLTGIRGAVARTMRVAIECVMNREMTMKSRESEIARVGSAEIRYLESHLRGLELASTIGPLLGLLGTVSGIVQTFARLSEAGSRVDPSMLAGGIWEALIATAAGLIVAIPAVAAYYVFDAVIEKVRAQMRDATIQILAMEDMYIKNEREQDRRELVERETAIRRAIEEQEKSVATMRSTPQSSATLRLLNPSYNRG